MTEERREESTGLAQAQVQEGGYQPLMRKGYQPTMGEPIDRIPPQGISAIIPVQPPSPPSGDTSSSNTPIPPGSPPGNKTVSSEETQ